MQYYRSWGGLFLLLICVESAAGQLTLKPSLIINEIITDNITLASKGESRRDEYITQVIPGVEVNRKSRRLDLNLNYSREIIDYFNEPDLDTAYNRLGSNAVVELEKDKFFFDASASIRQQVINNQQRIIVDNINPAVRTNITTYLIGPRLKNQFQNFADTTITARFGKVKYDNTNQLADSDILTVNAVLRSLRKTSSVEWKIKYGLNETRRGVGDKSKLESIDGDVGGNVTRRLSWLVRGGFVNDDVQALQALRTGYYYSFGLTWSPAVFLTLSGSYGSNMEDFSIEFRPSSRTRMRAEYMNRDLGANPGVRWTMAADYVVRRHTLTVRYSEDTSNLQTLEFAGGFVPSQGSVGGSFVNRNTLIFTPTNEDFIRKGLQFSYSLTGTKTSLRLNGGGERRYFLESEERDSLYGGNIIWDWRVGSKSNLTINGGYIKRSFGSTSVSDSNWYGGGRLSRQFTRKISGQVSYRYLERNERGSGDSDYSENRVNIGVVINFM